MGVLASQVTSLTIVYSTVHSGADQKTPKLRVTGLCAGNSPVTGEFPAQMASNAENVSIWWRHHDTHAAVVRKTHHKMPHSVQGNNDHSSKKHVAIKLVIVLCRSCAPDGLQGHVSL